jgi:GTP-binding protein Era
VAIIGRPNVGKSTLLNRILGQKLSITSAKVQTTRHSILGIKTTREVQTIYIDTPGLHERAKRALNKHMNRVASQSIEGVDLVVFLVEALIWKSDDELALRIVKNSKCPVIVAINKIDHVPRREELLAYLESLKNKMDFFAMIPISAKKAEQIDVLENVIENQLPEADFVFPEDQLTNRSERFLAAEIIREKLTNFLHQELPYSLMIEIEKFECLSELYRIAALILVETTGQKAIVIGDDGKLLKQVGTAARLDMEKLFGSKVFLQLWVKVRRGWPDDDVQLTRQGL